MTSDPTGRQFSTLYAPLDPDSALPPGLDERVVANAYKATRVLPKRVLLELGIRKYTETAAIRLRKALDDPAARARLHRPTSKVKPLHQAIYELLTKQPAYRPVYKRIVEPSEIVREESGRPPITELNPVEFKARVTTDQSDCSWSEREIGSQTEEEGLALFALAYGLLQPGDARSILIPILAIGASFREFFGVTDSVTPPLVPEVEAIDQPHPNDAPDGALVQQTHASPEEQVSHDVGSLEDTGGPSTKQTVTPYLDLRTQSLRKSLRTLQTRRTARKALGMADLLDEAAFRAARDLEVAALAHVRELEQSLRVQWEATTQHYAALAQEYGVRLRVDACPAAPEKTAESLDHLESDGAELLRLVAALRANGATARAVGISVPRVPLHQNEPVDLRGGIESLEKQLAATAELLQRAQRWKDTRKVLQGQLRDCAGVSPATSLATIGPEDVAALLEYSLVNSDWDTLRPLLFRLWSERFSWTDSAASTVSGALEQALGAAASSGDLDRHTEQVSYLERGTLQDLLGLPNAAVVRHVVLATFRESLARRDSLFLTAIWGFERAWTNRASTLGERLQRFFAILYQCFVRSKSAPLVMSLLVRPDVAAEGDTTNEIVRSRAQDANDVATQLEDAGHAPGLFGRLRFWAMTHQLKPIASAVREQRRADAVELFRVLQRRFRSGELVEEVVGAVGRRNTRADHRESLTRYVDDQIGVVTSWLSRTVSEREGQEDAELGRESLELRRFATQLARGSTRTGEILPGSISWLEAEVGRLIARLQAGEILVPSPSWLGDGALRPLPTQVRSWATYSRGSLGWRDLLQDQLAEHLLGVQRTLLEAIGELRTGGHLDAAIEAAKTADSDEREIREALEALHEVKSWRDSRIGDIEALYARLDTLEQGASEAQRGTIGAVKSDVLMALEEIDRQPRNATQSAIDSSRSRVTELEREMAAGVARRRALEQWLAAAEVVPPRAGIS